MSTADQNTKDKSDQDNKTITVDKPLPYKLYESTIPVKTYHFYINQVIGDCEAYTDMIHQLKTCTSNDTVFIYLNSPGGQVGTGIQIINAMKVCPAKIITVLESEAHSMATFLFLAGDEFVVHDNCRMMFHYFSAGMYGKGHEIGQHLEATFRWYEDLMREFYIPFLTPEECDRIIKGEELWLSSNDIRERLVNMVEIAQQEMDKQHINEAKRLKQEAARLMEQAKQMIPKTSKKKKATKKPAPRKKKQRAA